MKPRWRVGASIGLLFLSLLFAVPQAKAQDDSGFSGNWLGIACGDQNRITGLSILIVNGPGLLNTDATLNGIIGSDGKKNLKVNLTVHGVYYKDSDGNPVLVLNFAESVDSALVVQVGIDSPGHLGGLLTVVNTDKDGTKTQVGPDQVSFITAPDDELVTFYDQNKASCKK